MPNFMFLLHENEGEAAGISHDDMMARIKEYRAWSTNLRSENRLVGGEKLCDDNGRVVRSKNGKVSVKDGPYAESKEVVGGFFIVAAKDYAEACRLAEGCPHLKYYGRIEVRQIEQME